MNTSEPALHCKNIDLMILRYKMPERLVTRVDKMLEDEDVIKIVRQFLDEIQKSYKIESAFLYGSYAKGASNEWSDIDIAIVSSDFSDDLLKERLILTKLAIPIDNRIEPKPFNKESFNPNDPLVYEITKNGLPLI